MLECLGERCTGSWPGPQGPLACLAQGFLLAGLSPSSADHPHTECWDSLSMGYAVGELPTVPTLGMERKPTTGSFPPQFQALQTPSWELSCPNSSQVSVPALGGPQEFEKGLCGPSRCWGRPTLGQTLPGIVCAACSAGGGTRQS